MASVLLDQRAESSPAEEPIEHDDPVDEPKAEVKDRPNFASFHDQMKHTQEVFEELKHAVISSITVFKNNIATLNAKEERLVKLSSRISSINFATTIKLSVGGTIYQTSLETLTKYPGSLLSDMFSAKFDIKQGNDGCYFIDRDATHFRHILNYLRSGTAPVLSVLNTDAEAILQEAEYYGLDGLVKAINTKLNGDDDKGSENVKEEDEIAIKGVVDETRKELSSTEEKLNSFLKLLDANLKVLDEATSHHEEITKKLSNVHFGENVKIDVGGRIFKTSLKTVRRESESLLALMFSETFDLKKEDDGSFFVDRDGTLFEHILNYLRDGTISEDVVGDYGLQMQKEAEFYGLAGLKEHIRSYNQVKLNVGGREFVVARKTLQQYPKSMFGKMLSGKGCAFKKREDGSFYIYRDGTNFHHILEYLKYGIISDDVIKECGVSINDDAQFYMLPSLEETIHKYQYIKVKVGRRDFVISHKVLGKFPDSLFGRMLAGKEGGYVKRIDGSYFIQHDGRNFHHILSYIRSGTLSDGVIEEHSASLLADAEFYILPGLKERINNYHSIKMVIGTREFVVRREVLSKFPESLFGKMLEGRERNYVKRDGESYIIQRDAGNFHRILNYLRFGTLSDDVIEKNSGSLLADAEFYILPGLKELINNYHQVKMIIGTREFVVSREVLSKFPGSLFGAMLEGHEGNYFKKDDGSYFIDRDSSTFPYIVQFLYYGAIGDDDVQKWFQELSEDAKFYRLLDLAKFLKRRREFKLEQMRT